MIHFAGTAGSSRCPPLRAYRHLPLNLSGGFVPDRILRDELLESDRWLDLPTDAARLAFIGFLLITDDFGNFEGGSRRLFRFLHRFTQIKSEVHALECIGSLIECDLLRRYEVSGREFFHIPRFRPHRQYRVKKYPASPWCDQKTEPGKVKRVYIRGLAKNVVDTSHPRSNDVAEGVGVGVGVGVGKRSTPLPPLGGFSEFWQAYPKKVAKVQALKAWSKLKLGNSDFEKLMSALSVAKTCDQWCRDQGRFIPHPATWLNGKRFEDELSQPLEKVLAI